MVRGTSIDLEERMSETTRRNVLAGATGVSAAALLAACGDDEAAAPPPADPTVAPAAVPANALAKTSDIPINGGKVYADHGVVVTQPTSGEFKAFSSTCPHKGCALASVEDGVINCKCHGSRFALADGSVQGGPAKMPLEAKSIKVDGDTITML
jgi:Rieske Fe-S protein